jgi:hypothetical protein
MDEHAKETWGLGEPYERYIGRWSRLESLPILHCPATRLSTRIDASLSVSATHLAFLLVTFVLAALLVLCWTRRHPALFEQFFDDAPRLDQTSRLAACPEQAGVALLRHRKTQ